MTSLQIIGAGLGRTGTTSLREALEELGYSPCHHMDETFETQEHLNHLWKEIYHSRFEGTCHDDSKNYYLDNLLKMVFREYIATVDCPGYMFYDRFMEWNPEAKVILTVRDSPEQYVRSVQNTFFWGNREKSWVKRSFWKMVGFFTMPHHVYWIIEYIKKLHGVDPTHPATDLALKYTDWIDKVTSTVPPEKLLIFNVRDGWVPLCEFLGVDVPDRPFPKRNSSKEKNDAVKRISIGIASKRAVKLSAVLIVIVSAVVIGRKFSFKFP